MSSRQVPLFQSLIVVLSFCKIGISGRLNFFLPSMFRRLPTPLTYYTLGSQRAGEFLPRVCFAVAHCFRELLRILIRVSVVLGWILQFSETPFRNCPRLFTLFRPPQLYTQMCFFHSFWPIDEDLSQVSLESTSSLEYGIKKIC